MKWLAAVAAVTGVAFSLAGEHGIHAALQARQDAQRLTRDIATLRVENDRLRREADSLRSDPAVIEFVARQELGLTRPGELVLIRSAHR